jgi:uncharacterized protein with PQ loop repeat
MMACNSANKQVTGQSPQLLITYGFFILSGGAVWHLVADGAFSAVLTLSAMVQCLGLTLLGVQVLATGSASGISAKALTVDAIALCCRLSSTLFLNGYLPVDASGDHVYQITDLCSVGIIAWLLYQVLVEKRHTYQAEEDCLPIGPMVLGSVVLAFLLHGNMNARPFFDSMWLASGFLGTIAVLPQLWLITRTGGSVEALTSHHIAAMAVSRALSGLFMWHARYDITCAPWAFGFNHTIWAILGSHLLHMILLGDFGYYYIKAVMAKGLDARIQIDFDGCGV